MLKDRLKQARKAAKKSQLQVAEAIGVTQSALSQLETGLVDSSSFLPAIANYLGVNAYWLQTGQGDMLTGQQPPKIQDGVPQQTNITDLSIRHDGLPASKQTPVISWVAAGDFTEVLSADLSRVIEWIPYNPRAGQYGFALIVEGVSMEPKFMPDDRIYVNPTFQINELHTGDLVIMACDGDEKGTFKELVVEDGNYYLRPLNPNWQPRLMPVDHNCRLVGKVVGKFVNFE